MKGKTALITGASSGLGRALAFALAKEGVNLILSGRSADRLAETEKIVKNFNISSLTIQADLTNQADCKNLIESGHIHFGTIDYLILIAGVSMWSNFADVKDISLFEKLMSTNYLGSVYCTHFALPYLIESQGLIVVITSIQSKISVPHHSGYVASKHALYGFFNTLRMEVEDQGVGILTVLPHWIKGTSLRENALDGSGEKISGRNLMHTGESISLEECTGKIVDAMKKRRREIIIPFKLKILTWLNLFSSSLAEKIIRSKTKEQSTET